MQLLTDGAYLRVALPFMLSTLTQPLMGAVNTAVMGQMPEAKYMAAASLGAILFNSIYWLFGFLRVSTTGYAAQAYGARDNRLGTLAFAKPLVLAILVSALCLILQRPLISAYLALIAPEAAVAALCRAYYDILIWGAPCVLLNYVALGWLMGQARIRASVGLQMSMNILNMLLSWALVFYRGMGIDGVAWATLISQLYGGVAGAALIYVYGQLDWRALACREVFAWRSFAEMLQVNANLMLRTACLLTVNNLMAAVGAALGTPVLAANAVLLQLRDIMSFLIDGMANAAAIFSGRAVGAGSRALFDAGVRMTFKWLAVLAALLMGGYYLGSAYLIGLFTDLPEVIALAESYHIFVFFYPLCGGVGLVLYGVFCGATSTAPVRNMMFIAMLVFYAVQRILVPLFGNSGLWTAMLVFMLTQSVILWLSMAKLKNKLQS